MKQIEAQGNRMLKNQIFIFSTLLCTLLGYLVNVEQAFLLRYHI